MARYWRQHHAPDALRVRSVKASAGFFGLVVALHICAEVDVYGFDSGSEHYYKKKRISSKAFAQRHSWAAEQNCIERLRDAKLPHIRVHA